MHKRFSGFTIVELLIVIVVIAILAAISIVAYNGIQARARDTQRKSDAAQIAKAVSLYNVDHGNYMTEANCGGGGSGWGNFNYDYDGSTATLKSIAQCLIDAGVLQKELIDPSGERSTGRNYMKCGQYIYVSLEVTGTLPNADGPTNGTCAPTWDTAYNMNYYVQAN